MYHLFSLALSITDQWPWELMEGADRWPIKPWSVIKGSGWVELPLCSIIPHWSPQTSVDPFLFYKHSLLLWIRISSHHLSQNTEANKTEEAHNFNCIKLCWALFIRGSSSAEKFPIGMNDKRGGYYPSVCPLGFCPAFFVFFKLDPSDCFSDAGRHHQTWAHSQALGDSHCTEAKWHRDFAIEHFNKLGLE